MSYSGTILKFNDYGNNGLVVGRSGDIKPPSSYKVMTHDIDANSNRSMQGKLTRNRVRGGSTTAYEIQVSFTGLTWDELVDLISAGDQASFSLTFLDAKSKGTITKTMYRDANMTYELVKIFDDDEATWNTTMTFVEF